MPLDTRDYNPLDLPTSRERADGENDRLGTPTPEGAVLVQSADGDGAVSVNEDPDSPTVERAEQTTTTHSYTMSWEAAKTQQDNMPRGAIFYASDPADDPEWTPLYKVLSTRIKHSRGEYATLEVVSEQLNGDVPPDQFNITPVELNLNIIKHPRYYRALVGDPADPDQGVLNTQVIRELQNYMDNPSYAARNAIAYRMFQSLGHPGSVVGGIPTPDAAFPDPADADKTVSPITGTDFAKYAALELISKHWLGIENPYIVGWKITYSRYFWRPQNLHPGGIVQDPLFAGPDTVDEQFLIAPHVNYEDGIQTVPDDTIFWRMHLDNPQCYLPVAWSYNPDESAYTDISWLRQADQMYFERTFHRVDYTWLGAPMGTWDAVLFSNNFLDVPTADTTLGAGGAVEPLVPNYGYSGIPMSWIPKPPSNPK